MQNNYLFIKRIIDIILSLLLIVITCPVFLIVSFLVYFKLGSPVIFSQNRPGLKNKIFKMYKFRTMEDLYDSNGDPLPDKLRTNRFGLILRALSLDELPELFNIIKGDMSFVGPRPLLVKYLNIYTDKEIKRHNVRPGLTGLAQINGRNAISWKDKFQFDLYYVEHISFMLDLKIFMKTFLKVLFREGINSENSVTMAELTHEDLE